MTKSVYLVAVSAFVLAGVMAKPGDVVEVTEDEAVNLLNRGKATLATEDNLLDDDEGGRTAAADSAAATAESAGAKEKGKK